MHVITHTCTHPHMCVRDKARPRGRQLHTVLCQNKSILTNLMKISRIEWYNGKYGLNPQGIREIFYDLLDFDQIGRSIDDRNWGKWYFMKENFKKIPQNQKSLNLTLISQRN